MIDLNYKDQDPIGNLLLYLNSRMELSQKFNPAILPIIQPETLTDELIAWHPGDTITTAYWLEDSYGYLYKMVEDKSGVLQKKITEIFPPKTIMVDPLGFFQNEPSKLYMAMVKGATFVPFRQMHFASLRLDAPEADALATRVVAETGNHNKTRTSLLELKGDERYHEMIRYYGRKILQCFSQKHLALFLNYSPEHLNKLIAADNRGRNPDV